MLNSRASTEGRAAQEQNDLLLELQMSPVSGLFSEIIGSMFFVLEC